jgi:predicted  nucleic acid-binding Zn-ribbon protein
MPDSGPAKERVSCGEEVMNVEEHAARKARKLRASRDRWKQRSAEKQQQIRQLRVTVRDLSISREHWKQRVQNLEQQLLALQAAHPVADPDIPPFLERLKHHRVMPETLQTPLSLTSD